MSYQRGMAAICLEMPDIVPRTEYSAEFHWPLVNAVTGSNVNEHSDPQARKAATNAFINAWEYGFNWNILTTLGVFGEKQTLMGRAEFAAGGVDFSNKVSSLFEDPKDVYDYDLFEAYGAHDIKTLTAEYDAHYDAECSRGLDTISMTGIYVTCMSGLIGIIGKKCPGFFLAVGNHIPANTPVDNALYYDDIYRKMAKR